MPCPDVVGKKIVWLVSKYFSSDRNTAKVLGNLLFGKNYTTLEFGPDLKEFLRDIAIREIIKVYLVCEEHNNIKQQYKVHY